jgi:hypothetical protein
MKYKLCNLILMKINKFINNLTCFHMFLGTLVLNVQKNKEKFWRKKGKRLTQPEANTLIENQLLFKIINYTATKSSVLLISSIQYLTQLRTFQQTRMNTLSNKLVWTHSRGKSDLNQTVPNKILHHAQLPRLTGHMDYTIISN